MRLSPKFITRSRQRGDAQALPRGGCPKRRSHRVGLLRLGGRYRPRGGRGAPEGGDAALGRETACGPDGRARGGDRQLAAPLGRKAQWVHTSTVWLSEDGLATTRVASVADG